MTIEDVTVPWASIAIQVKSDSVGPAELAVMFGGRATASVDHCVIELTEDDSVPLEDQMSLITSFVRTHEATLSSIGTYRTVVSIGWHPRGSQDGTLFGQALVSDLARLNASIGVYTYIDE